MLQAATTRVAAVRADVTTKPIDVMGYEEPACLLTAEVVEPFEMLVVKARTKITFNGLGAYAVPLLQWIRRMELSHLGLIVTGAYTVLKRGSKTVPHCSVQYYGVTYPPQKRAEDC